MTRHLFLSISPDGRVYYDGFLMGRTESVHTAWGAELWGYQVAGVNMATYYVEGVQRDAAIACAKAYIARRQRNAEVVRRQSRSSKTA